MAASENPRAHTGAVVTADGARRPPLPHFFLERYLPSYVREWQAFVEAVQTRDDAAGVDRRCAGAAGDRARRAAVAARGAAGAIGRGGGAMRIYLTGASGFVGSNLAHVFAHEHGAEVVAPGHDDVDLDRRVMVRRRVLRDPARRDRARRDLERPGRAALRPPPRLGRLRRAPPATPSSAANAVDAQFVLISTDWVFDGTQAAGRRDRAAQPDQHLRRSSRPARELIVARDRRTRDDREDRRRAGRAPGPAAHAARPGRRVRLPGRLAGARRCAPTSVHAVGRCRASTSSRPRRLRPTPPSLVWRALEREVTGVLHCCGGEHADRVGLAAARRRSVRARSGDLLDVGPAPPRAVGGERVPARHRASTRARPPHGSAVELADLDGMLARLGEDLAMRVEVPA